MMAATGQTWEELCREAQAGFLARFAEAQENPECPFARYLVFREFPYGQDPLLEKEAWASLRRYLWLAHP